ncbi:MAG: ECF transporter S component [bacterium]
MKNGTVLGNKAKIREMTLLAMFIAIILVMIFVPYMGFITIPPGLSVTLIHLPVLIGAVLLGRKGGIILGLTFGIGSFLRALTSVGLDYLFIFPWVSILPRFIFGFLIYDVYRLLHRLVKVRLVALMIAFFTMTVIHTLIVLPMLVTTFPIALGNASLLSILGDATATAETFSSWSGLWLLIGIVMGSNGIIEAAIAGTIGAVIADRLIAFRDKNAGKNVGRESGEVDADTD